MSTTEPITEWDVVCTCGFHVRDTGMTAEGHKNLFLRVIEHRVDGHKVVVRESFIDKIGQDTAMVLALREKVASDPKVMNYLADLFTKEVSLSDYLF